jgi:protein TonB
MRLYAWIALSIGLHAAIARVPIAPPRAPLHEKRPPIEIEVVPPREPPVQEPVAPIATAPRRASATPRRAAPAVHVPAVLTSGDATDGDVADAVPPPTHDEGPVSFGADPAYGVGPAPKAPTPPPKPPPAPVVDLARPARLDEADPCRGHFPSSARVDAGTVTLALAVDARGVVTQASVVGETPPGEGFGAAARACLLEKRFSPAQAKSGETVASSATVRIRFSR